MQSKLHSTSLDQQVFHNIQKRLRQGLQDPRIEGFKTFTKKPRNVLKENSLQLQYSQFPPQGKRPPSQQMVQNGAKVI